MKSHPVGAVTRGPYSRYSLSSDRVNPLKVDVRTCSTSPLLRFLGLAIIGITRRGGMRTSSYGNSALQTMCWEMSHVEIPTPYNFVGAACGGYDPSTILKRRLFMV